MHELLSRSVSRMIIVSGTGRIDRNETSHPCDAPGAGLNHTILAAGLSIRGDHSMAGDGWIIPLLKNR